MERLAVKPSVLKSLFAKSHNQCAFHGCEVPCVTKSNVVLANICHIAAVNPQGARYDPKMSAEELRHIDNLLLLCPSHHKLIDTDESFSVSRIRKMKEEHEADENSDVDLEVKFVALNDHFSRAVHVYNEIISTTNLPEAVVDRLLMNLNEKDSQIEDLCLEVEHWKNKFEGVLKKLKDAERYFEDQILELIAQDEFERVIEMTLDEIVKNESNAKELNGLLANVYLMQGAPQKAVDVIEASLDILPHDDGLRLDLIEAYLWQDDIDNAAKELLPLRTKENSMIAGPLVFRYAQARGRIEMEFGRPKEVYDLLTKAMEQPQVIDGFSWIMLQKMKWNCMNDLAMYPKVVGEIKAVISDLDHRPDTVQALAHTLYAVEGIAHYQMQDFDTALKCFEKAENLLPEPQKFDIVKAAYLENQGTSLAKLGRTTEAMQKLENVKSHLESNLNPDHVLISKCLHSLAICYNAQGDFEKSAACYLESIDRMEARNELHVQLGISHNNLGLVYRSLGKRKPAEKCFRRAIEIETIQLGEGNQKLASRYYNLGLVLLVQRKAHSALSAIRKALKLEKHDLPADGEDLADYEFLISTCLLIAKEANWKKGYKKAFSIYNQHHSTQAQARQHQIREILASKNSQARKELALLGL